jgi:AraC-like DNA-binding protein
MHHADTDGKRPAARVRLMGDSFLVARDDGFSSRTQRYSASVIVAIDARPLAVATEQGRFEGALLLVAPCVAKRIDAPGRALVLLDIETIHPQHRRILLAPRLPPVLELDAARHGELLRLVQGFHGDGLQGRAVNVQTQRAIDELAQLFPAPPALDARVEGMQARLDDDPTLPLARLAARFGLSPQRASTLFRRHVGLSLRQYALAGKVRRAAQYIGEGRRLTDVALDAGFVDSAHFAKVWTAYYGAPPSQHFRPPPQSFDRREQPGWLQWHLARRAPGLSQRTPRQERGVVAAVAAAAA